MSILKRLFRLKGKREWEPQYEQLKREVAGLPPESPLWGGILGFLDRSAQLEVEALCQPNVTNDELRRCQGRLGMVLDLRQQLEELPELVQQEEKARVQKKDTSVEVPGVVERM